MTVSVSPQVNGSSCCCVREGKQRRMRKRMRMRMRKKRRRAVKKRLYSTGSFVQFVQEVARDGLRRV